MAELALIGTALSAVGSIQQGNAANKAAGFQAAQLEQQARAERAASQREAIEKKRQVTLAGSRARAISAAGGGALAAPTVANILGGLEYEGEQAKRYSLAQGEEAALGLETGAAAKRIEGKQAKKSGVMGAVGSVAKFAGGASGQTLFDKYGGGK